MTHKKNVGRAFHSRFYESRFFNEIHKELRYNPSRNPNEILNKNQMKVYSKQNVQHINASMEECWDFFSSPRNLQKITPESMGFQITDFDNKNMYAGQIIQYKVSPLFGIKLPWVTEITIVKERSYFIDEQRFGPYALWHHKHFFEATENGVKMTDLVHYALPLGFIGRIINALIVKNKLKEIFDHRERKVNEIFNSK